MDRPEDTTIVLAEDDPGHARLIEKNLRSIVTNEIVRFADGRETLEYLRREERASRQHLLLLDLNMPVMNGYQVLWHLRNDEQTSHIPVIVLTTTDDPEEIRRCYDMGCNAYVVKSADYDKFTDAMRCLGLFLTVAMMPRGGCSSVAIPGARRRIGLRVTKPTGWQGPEAVEIPAGEAESAA